MTQNFQSHSVSSANRSLRKIDQNMENTEFCQSDELNRQILDSSDDCIKVLDLEGRILFMSRGGQALLKIQDITPFLNTSWAEFWQGSDRETVLEAIAVARSGEVCTFQGYRPTLTGEPKWWDSKISPIRGVDGQIERLLCISRDITEHRLIDTTLRASEAKYRTLFNSMDEGYLLADVLFDEHNQPIDVFYLDANPAAIQMVGQDFTGRRLSEVNPTCEPHWYEMFGRVARTGKGERLEQYVKPKKRWYDFYIFKVEDRSSNRVAVIFQNITDRKRHEANAAFLAEISQEFSRLSSADEIMQKVGAKIGNFMNLSYCHFMCIDESRDELVLLERWNAEDVPELPDIIRLSNLSDAESYHLAAAGETIVHNDAPPDSIANRDAQALNLAMSSIMVPAYRSDEQKYLFSVHDVGSRVWQDDEIELVHELANRLASRLERARVEDAVAADLKDMQLLRDLSVRLISEDDSQVLYDEIVAAAIALARSDAGMIQILDVATQELVLLAAQGFEQNMQEHFYRVNAHSNTLCGVALTNGTRSFIHFDVPESNDPNGSWQLYIKAGYLSGQSTPFISRSGRPIGMISTYWRKHHQPSERELRFLDLLVRQAADLIEQRQAETERRHLLEREKAARTEAERANRIKDEFLAILSHELRSPLNPILGWSRLLQTKKLDEVKTLQALATIERNAKLQTQLIDDLLDIARILRGKLNLNQMPVNLVSVIQSALEVVKTAADAKSISLHSELMNVGPVRGDDARLQQIVWNLLSNAIKFTPAGGRVEVRLNQVDENAQIAVIDTGKGISPEFIPYIFDSFRQEDASITRQHGGLGLGLSIVKYLVDAHGGTIVADSLGEDQGTTFTMKLPLLKGSANSPAAVAPSATDINLAGIKILAVDDSEDARELLATSFIQYGADVRVVASGREVLAHLDSFKPDVLVCDIGIPDIDGYTLLKRIRALPPERNGTVPAIAVTAYAREEDQQHALENGFQKYITKPIEPDRLAIAVAEMVTA